MLFESVLTSADLGPVTQNVIHGLIEVAEIAARDLELVPCKQIVAQLDDDVKKRKP